MMIKDQKFIKAKVGLLELAKQLGNVSQACKMLGYSRDSFYRFKELYDKGSDLIAARDQSQEADCGEPGRARAFDDTWKMVGKTLDAFAPDECANYLRNPGYASV
jgi:hypothetical protein